MSLTVMRNRQSAKSVIDHFSESLREQKVSKELIILSAVELHERLLAAVKTPFRTFNCPCDDS
jgi:hypothetical protein